MERSDLVLAALSTSSEGWTPVQVQKLFFLLDRRLGDQLGGPHFNHTAYDYGPFDASVYRAIQALVPKGLTRVDQPPFGMRTFAVTPEGAVRGQEILNGLPPQLAAYIRDLASWVRGLSFRQLVTAVYRDFPEMAANSVFYRDQCRSSGPVPPWPQRGHG